MPRSMSEKYDEAFRIVATVAGRRGDGSDWGYTRHYGPYATIAAAKGQITSLRQHYSRDSWPWRDGDGTESFDAYIEKSSASWERVE